MATLTCIICNGANAKLCSTCHSIAYCSPTCQKTDWSLHKTICKSFEALPARPSPSHRRAILLPVNSKDPQLIWLVCERHTDEDGGTWEMPLTRQHLDIENLDSKYDNGKEFKPITRNVRRGYNLDHTVRVICRDAFLMDGSSPNVCLQHVTKGRMPHDWKGPIVVLRQSGTAMDPLIHEDIKAGDLRVAVDYFFAYGGK